MTARTSLQHARYASTSALALSHVPSEREKGREGREGAQEGVREWGEEVEIGREGVVHNSMFDCFIH